MKSGGEVENLTEEFFQMNSRGFSKRIDKNRKLSRCERIVEKGE